MIVWLILTLVSINGKVVRITIEHVEHDRTSANVLSKSPIWACIRLMRLV